MKANELKGNDHQLKSKILNSRNTKFYVNSPISYKKIRISKIEASESVFSNLATKLVFSDCKDGILIERFNK